MINVPYAIKKLFEKDSISKNFRVHFPNGEYRDLVNTDIVSESVSFTESINSSNEFRFGFIEGANIRFKTFFNHNIRGLKIFCSIEIDITSCGESFIQLYGQTSDDVPYPFYSVPYGYFIVDSCKLSESSDIREVIAYQQKFEEKKDSAFIPKLELAKLIWGYTLHYPLAATIAFTEPIKMKLNSTKFALSCFSSLDFLGEPVHVYDEESDIFNHDFGGTEQDNHNRLNPTIKVRYFAKYDPTIATEQPVTIYKVLVKGRTLVFGDQYYKYFDYNYLNLETSYTKKYAELDYLDDAYMYNLSWKNHLSVPEAGDFEDEFVYETLKDELSTLCSPCIRFCDCGTYAGAGDRFWVAHPQYTVQNAGAFPLNSTVNLAYASGESETELSEYDGGSWLNGRFVRTNNYYISDYIKHVTQSDASNSSSYDAKKVLATLNSNGYQNYIDIPVFVDRNGRCCINIDPDMLKPLNPNDVHVPSTWQNNYNDACGDRLSPTTQTRTKHIEFCVPTEIVVIKWTENITGDIQDNNDVILGEVNRISQYFSLPNPSIGLVPAPELPQVIPINDFASPVLKAFDISEQISTDLTFDTQYIRQSPDVQTYDARIYDYVFDDNYVANYPSRAETEKYNIRLGYVFTVNNPLFKKISEFIEYVITDSVAKEIMSSYAELNAMLLRYSRTQEDVVEQIAFDDEDIKLLLPSNDLFPDDLLYPLKTPGLYPSKFIFPNDTLFPEDVKIQYFTTKLWRKIYIDDEYNFPYTSVSYTMTLLNENNEEYQKKISVDIIIEGVEVKNGKELVLNDSWLLRNSNLSELEAAQILVNMATHLSLLYYYSINMTTRALPYFEAGDSIRIITQKHGYKTKLFRHTISGVQSLIDSIENR